MSSSQRSKFKRKLKYKVHHEGRAYIISLLFLFLLLNWMSWHFIEIDWVSMIVSAITIILFLITINFYRSPKRINAHSEDSRIIVAPADGKLVTVEEVYEAEILKAPALKVSIFMSITNVHVNWPAVNGEVLHVSHTEGNFLRAFLPKSSTENERSAVVIRTLDGHKVLERQIAGAIARRIVTYFKEGDMVTVNHHLGFIKFGSRIDLYLPLNTKILLPIGSKVTGNTTILGELPVSSSPIDHTESL